MPGNDIYTKLLLHCDGADESTSFSDSSASSQTVNAVSPAQVDTDQKVFGTGSMLGDGTTAHLNVTDFPELDMGSADFTYDFRIRFISTAGNQGLFGRYDDGNSYFYFALETGKLRFRDYNADTVNFDRTWNPSTDTWYHIAVIRNGTDIKIFVDGTQLGATETGVGGSFTARSSNLNIGGINGLGGYYLNGWMEEFRYSPGIARWTSNFTPPTHAYDNIDVVLYENLTLSDSWSVGLTQVNLNLTENLTLSDSWSVFPQLDNAKKVIYDTNNIYFITDTNPVYIVKIDISTPATPSKTVYQIAGVTSAKDFVLNNTNNCFYVACDSGKVVKITKVNLNSQTIINTSETDIFVIADSLDAYLKTFVSTDDSSGEIVMIDEATITKMNSDIRWAKEVQTTINCAVNTILGKLISTDVRFSSTPTQTISTDIRWLKYAYAELSQHMINHDDIQVKINGTDLAPLDDVDLKSINITHIIDTFSTARFKLNRKHDKPNFDNHGNASEITNKNSVQIYINGILEFDGNINKYSPESSSESIVISARMTEPSHNKQTKSIPLATVGEKLNPYHCLIDGISVDNPVLDTRAILTNGASFWTGTEWVGNRDEAEIFDSHAEAQSTAFWRGYTSQKVYPINYEEPEYFNGIQINLGTAKYQQKWTRYISSLPQGMNDLLNPDSQLTLVEQIEKGSFQQEQNLEYFWFAEFENFVTGKKQEQLVYIGTTLGVLSTDTYKLEEATYIRQVPLTPFEKDLGWYYVGSAPFKIISTKNGKYVPHTHYVDDEHGLKIKRDAGYNYIQYAKDVANLELLKLQTVNSEILPRAEAQIELTMDGYYFYNIELRNRINLSNTTTPGIYSDNQGFPVAVTSISINTNTMKVTCQCDSSLAIEDMYDIDRNRPDITSDKYTTKLTSKYQWAKFDPIKWNHVELPSIEEDDE